MVLQGFSRRVSDKESHLFWEISHQYRLVVSGAPVRAKHRSLRTNTENNASLIYCRHVLRRAERTTSGSACELSNFR